MMDLVEVLASLYPTPQDAQRLADNSEIEIQQATIFGLSSPNMWHSVVTQARLQGKLPKLMMNAYSEYPSNAQLSDYINELLMDHPPKKSSSYHLERALTDLEARVAALAAEVAKQAQTPPGSLTGRTMTEAILFALVIIVLIFVVRG